MATVPELHGRRVRLRPIRDDDLPVFIHWLADPEITCFMAGVMHLTVDEERKWARRVLEDPNEYVFSVEAEDGVLIGNCRLSLKRQHHAASFGIMIGAKERWGRGYCQDVLSTVLRYGFEEHRLHRIYLSVKEENVAGRRCYEKCGFVVEGLLREAELINGTYHNVIRMGILDREWQARYEQLVTSNQ
ncbi:MAG TPA: N-acetyltransferase [Anaerolineae bacterium]|nr:N-acetyltransferase [Anaerolineae bacterium]